MSLIFRSEGDGQTNLLILNGWGAPFAYWRPLVDLLSPYFKITRVDYPGIGDNIDFKGSMQDFLDAIVDELQTPCYLLAWSFGGSVATALATQWPERIKGILMIASNPCFVAQEDWPGMQEAQFNEFYDEMQADPERQLKYFQGLALGSRLRRSYDIRQATQELVYNKTQLLEHLSALRLDYRKALSALNTKALCIFSDDDALVPFEVATRIESLNPRIESIVMKSATHAPFYTEPYHLSELIKEFCHE